MRITSRGRAGRLAAAVLLPAGLAAVTACSAGSAHTAQAGSSSAPPTESSSAATTHAASSAAATKSKPATRTSQPRPAPLSTISIPPNLCAATDKAQNTADAYMGALSAGNEKEALDCVFGKSVPLSTTHALLAHQQETAVYLPKQDGADGPTDFDYTGNGKAVRVTVTRLADGHTWVTRVSVHQL